MEIGITFEKVERSYTTSPGWRLATFKEAKGNGESVTNLLGYWDRARLLDGWAGGGHFENAIKNEYNGCMGYMIITQVSPQANSSSGKGLYDGVILSFESKIVALRMSAEDWNLELVYWILNSLEEADTMDISDVTDGRIPLLNTSDVAEMKSLNMKLNDLARQLWDAPFSVEEGSRKLDPRSVRNTFHKIWESLWNKFSDELKKFLGRRFRGLLERKSLIPAFGVEDSASLTVTFGWQYISLSAIIEYRYYALGALMKKWLNEKSSELTTRERNFILSISLMFYYYSVRRTDRSRNLENSKMLDKVFDMAAKNGDVIMMKKVLDCGLGTIGSTGTVLHTALNAHVSEDKMLDMVKMCLDKFETKENIEFVNKADEKGMAALHLASLQGKARVCKLLIARSAKLDVPDKTGRVPLHHAVEKEREEVIDLLIGNFDGKELPMLSVQNDDGQTPLDAAAAQNNIKIMTKLLPFSKQTFESYFDRVDRVKLLHVLAFQGSADIVGKLLQRGLNPQAADKEGKTALHFAATCNDSSSASKTIEVILRNCKDPENLKAMVDREGKTALHFLALNGNSVIGIHVLGDLIDKKDIYDRSPLYYVLQSNMDRVGELRLYIQEMEKRGSYFGDLVDSTGQTSLHVAALAGKIYQVNFLLSRSRNPKRYVSRADYLGQTALHKAAGGGHVDTIIVLLRWGAQPLLERDCDGRTAMHYVVQAKSGNGRIEVAKLILKNCGSDDKKLLFLWALAAGVGTAEQILNDSDPLKEFLLDQRKQLSENSGSRVGRKNLLRIAACTGDTDMTKELLTRGGQITAIEDITWIEKLESLEEFNVRKVLSELRTIAKQGNDQPTAEDKLGRDDFARSFAALLLNPYLEPPIAVGIFGTWGKGKSSLMLQTEISLLKTAAQSLLLPTSESSDPNFPGAQARTLSIKGEKKYKEVKRWVDFMKNESNTGSKNTEAQKKDSLFEFLHNYDSKYHAIFKSLAAMDTSEMFSSESEQPSLSIESVSKRSVPAVLTVQYNAWMYQNESEALAGLAVEITKEMEGIMTEPQRMSTCLRNSWRKQKQSLWTELLFRCILAIFLAGMFISIIWTVLDRYHVKEVVKLKYASLPPTIVFTVWRLVKSVMSVAKPVSSQLMNYSDLPDHSEKLGYQERVISDINFLKKEIGRKPYFVCTAISCLLRFITGCCGLSFLYPKLYRYTSFASVDPRIVVFIDDLDRCEESVILQVLSSINLVLAVCKISVIVGMDKALIEQAIVNKYGDKSVKYNKQLADKYLQKIIQLPLDLPDPSEEESKRFLDTQLGVFSRPNMKESPEAHACHNVQEEVNVDYDELFSIAERKLELQDLGDHLMQIFTQGSSMQDTTMTGETSAATEYAGESSDSVTNDTTTGASGQSYRGSISIRDMLFVRYSEGERDAFCHFQKMATDCRKLPREWKRLLCYHRLVWYMLYVGSEVNSLLGWQVQLITWVFTCWEWEENMNIIIENWNSIGILKDTRSDSGKPSLRAIVEHFIKEESRIIADRKNEKVAVTTNEKVSARLEQDTLSKDPNIKDLKQKAVSKETQDPESSNTKPNPRGDASQTIEGETNEVPEHSESKDAATQTLTEGMNRSNSSATPESKNVVQSNELIKDQMMREKDGDADFSERKSSAVSQKLEDIVEIVREEVKKAIRDKIEKSSRKEMDELHKKTDKLHKEIKELKEVKQQSGKNKMNEEERKARLKTWKRMRSALRRYDVSMEGIVAFQRFRFYCVACYLPWPLPSEETEDLKYDCT